MTDGRVATLVANELRGGSLLAMIGAVSRRKDATRRLACLHVHAVRDRIYVHIVWTTRNREPTIDLEVARFLGRFLPAVAWQERAGVHAMGVVQTHLHLLLQLHPTTSIPRLLQRLKGGSSVIANREGHASRRPLRWAKGYSITSVSPRVLDAVRSYVWQQPAHHPKEAIPGWEPAERRVFAAESRDSAELSRETTPTPVTVSESQPSRDLGREQSDQDPGRLRVPSL